MAPRDVTSPDGTSDPTREFIVKHPRHFFLD
jgi:hypothetical protein